MGEEAEGDWELQTNPKNKNYGENGNPSKRRKQDQQPNYEHIPINTKNYKSIHK